MLIALILGYGSKELVQFANSGPDLGSMKMDKLERMLNTYLSLLLHEMMKVHVAKNSIHILQLFSQIQIHNSYQKKENIPILGHYSSENMFIVYIGVVFSFYVLSCN